MKFRAYLLLIFALIANMWLFEPAIAADEKDVIRVGLSNSSFSTFEFSETTVVTSSVATVMDMANGAKIADIPANREIEAVMKNGRFFINIGGKEVMTAAQGPILVVSKGNLGIKNLNRKGNPAYYRGMIELTPVLPQNKNKFNIVNILDAQSYLKGVVPNEMPVRFGLNALKAQAVAARNYANRPQNPYKNYDICDSTACQVYFGVNSENPLSDRAVDETQGIFALYNKEPILALYSSTSGGITEDYECVYGTGNSANNSKPYLKSKKDYVKLQKPKSEEELRDFYSKNIPSFDMKSPRHRWKAVFERFELEEILTKTLREQSLKSLVYPAFGEKDEVWGLEDIRVVKRGESGKALEVEIRSMGGTWRVKKELGIRRVFKRGNSMLWSGNFVIEKKMPETIEKSLPDTLNAEKKPDLGNEKPESKESEAVFTSTNISKNLESPLPVIKKAEIEAVSKVDDKKKVFKNRLGIPLPLGFTFIGAGFGHGVGMSQYGAGYLASVGAGYDAILKHYYSGITLGTMPRGVQYNNYGKEYTTYVYFDGPNVVTAGDLPSPIGAYVLKDEILTLHDASNKPAKYILKIDNSKNLAAVDFHVNDSAFNLNMKEFHVKIYEMDITKYLKKGKNTIKFLPLKSADKEKTTSFWVEIEK